jgi:hypothetical protein
LRSGFTGFEHEQKLRELMVRQAQLNAALDLDKGSEQVAEEDRAEEMQPPMSHVEQVTASRADGVMARMDVILPHFMSRKWAKTTSALSGPQEFLGQSAE